MSAGFMFYLLLLFGSNASRRPSPIKLMHKTVVKIANPGGIQAAGLLRRIRKLCASEIMLPQVGVG